MIVLRPRRAVDLPPAPPVAGRTAPRVQSSARPGTFRFIGGSGHPDIFVMSGGGTNPVTLTKILLAATGQTGTRRRRRR
jgi:hypothetical protein